MVKPAREAVLEVRDLKTYFFTRRGVVRAVDGVSFSVARGQTVGLVGESGCGKSMTCLSIVRLIPRPAARIVGGQVLLHGTDLVALSEREMRGYRGRHVAMILQDPMTSLNPVYTIGNQLHEALRHWAGDRKGRQQRVVELLRMVRIPAPAERTRNFPHQMSGGMRQRAVAAMALGAEPDLLIADEPTTALDVTTQAQFLRLLRELQDKTGIGIVLVTHDLGIVAQNCTVVAVMYAGRIVEMADVRSLYRSPRHPYTVGLLNSIPRLGQSRTDRLYSIEGQPPSLLDPPPGCRFADRCPHVKDVCRSEYPPTVDVGSQHQVACWLAVEGA